MDLSTFLTGLLKPKTTPDPKEILAQLPSPRALAGARYRAADRCLQIYLPQFLAPAAGATVSDRGAVVDEILIWSNRRMEARLDAYPLRDQQIAILAEERAFLKRLEDLFKILASSGGTTASPIDLLRVEYQRLEIESRLARFKGR